MCDSEAETYVKLNLSATENSMMAQLRMGILPLRLETGRFCNLKINERLCQICNQGIVEDELHFLFQCKKYKQTRDSFFIEMSAVNNGFTGLSDVEKLQYCCSKETWQDIFV